MTKNRSSSRVHAVLAGAFRRALAKAMKVIPGTSTIATLRCVRIGDGRITGTDLDCAVSASVEGLTGPAFCVPALMLSRLLAGMPADSLITMRPDSGHVVINFDGGRAALVTIPADDFPAFPERGVLGEPMPFPVAAVASVAPAIFREETRYCLHGVHLSPQWATAADGHRLFRRRVDVPGVAPCVVPRLTVAIIAALFGKSEGVTFRQRVGEAGNVESLHIECDGLAVDSNVVNGDFPDVGRVIPEPGAPVAFSGDRDAMLAVVSRIGRAFRSGVYPAATIMAGSEAATIRAIIPDAGEIVCAFPADVFESRPMGFNARYLEAVLRFVPPGRVTARATDPISPLMIAAEGGNHVAVQMPMRVGKSALKLLSAEAAT